MKVLNSKVPHAKTDFHYRIEILRCFQKRSEAESARSLSCFPWIDLSPYGA